MPCLVFSCSPGSFMHDQFHIPLSASARLCVSGGIGQVNEDSWGGVNLGVPPVADRGSKARETGGGHRALLGWVRACLPSLLSGCTVLFPAWLPCFSTGSLFSLRRLEQRGSVLPCHLRWSLCTVGCFNSVFRALPLSGCP